MRLLAPEVVQTSAMDCGPAALKCLLAGHGIAASYGRLREACQTTVDGTSIDTLEEVANRLGLVAEQVMVPVDHLPLAEAGALPALVVVRQPTGLTHFVVVWRRHGAWLQVMDPAVGRRWVRWSRLREEVFVHAMPVPAEGWREWAGSGDFTAPLARRLRALGAGAAATQLVAAAVASPGWRPLAALDAATRMVAALVEAGGVARGAGAARLVTTLAARGEAEDEAVPNPYWSVRPAPAGEEGEEQLWFRGAVLLRVRGRHPAATGLEAEPELAAALAEAEPRPLREIARLLGGDPAGARAVLLGGVAVGAATVVLEALLLRGVMEIGARLGLVQQRLEAAGYLLLFLLAALALEAGVVRELARLGRRLEVRLRAAFLAKIPRLPERYFGSRPVSDMAERSHAIHQVRALPRWGGQLMRAGVQLLVTVGAIAWLFPRAALPAALAALATLALPLLFLPVLSEQDLRVRTHGGALARFQLDSLLGLAAVRSHAAEPAVLREQESLLAEWARAGRARLRTASALELAQGAVGIALAVWAFLRVAAEGSAAGSTLLLAYWALAIPALGGDIALLLRQLPTFRSLTLRLLEPLGAPEEPAVAGVALAGEAKGRGAAVSLRGVSVRAAGHTILDGVDLEIRAGEHLAVVGPSGAGKSSLVGLLLGVHRAESGRLEVDGEELTEERLARLREGTAWVDPAVHLWNRTLLENLVYGTEERAGAGIAAVLAGADLLPVLNHLEGGMQGGVGEGGGLLSGGEGQRVRLGRAMLRADARLVILDEPFRGLDGARRRALLARVRAHWREATLICVTHDVADTIDFDRVVVVEGGRIAAHGDPAELARDCVSRYAGLLRAEREMREAVWGHQGWRRSRIEDGRLVGA